MTKSEKRYFKLHAGVHTIGEKNVYMKLFDTIDEMKVYDEEIISKKFKGEKFTKNLFSAKKYLFELVLKILYSYKREGNIDLKLHSMLADLDIIQEKGLYKLYKSRLQQIEKLAVENEKYYALASILEKKAVYVLTEFYEGKVNENMDLLRIEMSEVLDKIKYTYEYKMLYDKLFFLLKHADTKITGGNIKVLEEYISDPLFKDESKTVTPTAKYFYYTILAHYYYWLNDSESSYKYRKALVEFMESYPRYKELYPKSYISALANLGAVCERVKRYEEMITYAAKVKSFMNEKYGNHKDNKDSWAKIINTLCDIELNYYISTCRFDDFEEVARIIDDLEKYTDIYNEPRKIGVYNSVSFFYFICKDYTTALSYINKTLNYKNIRPEERGYAIARLVSLIIHYEMGNYDLLEYTIKSTRNYLVKTESFYTFEKLLIDFFTDAINTNDDKQLKRRLVQLNENLKKIERIGSLLDAFDILSWVESKIIKKDLKNILIEKRKSQLASGVGN